MTAQALKQTIQEDMKAALKAGDNVRLGTIRLLLAAIKQREVDERISLDEAAIIAVVEKLIKQRKESIAQYLAGGRPELAAKEEAEIEVLKAYLPAPADEAEIAAVIDAAVAEVRASGVGGGAAMGKVMSIVKAKLAGRADMAAVSARVKAALG
ncbi:MAG: GatB/YqeY domain-containing protein [Casimicrobiaceae bacterium]|nr:GatB/YqeY domain-containing protein [Casimicrobiaceae bacterium]MCX8097770.1 GatB/YqeY domain-containing protein [Casimicrobiaceae bacterium]MDW8311887.1 GatB/YqeY domain-containing protein [Burkholderiales bacterium]